MKHVSIRFLIGLSQHTDTLSLVGLTRSEYDSVIEARRLGALTYLSAVYKFGATYSGTGYWAGQSEPCMSFETIEADSPEGRELARGVARELARMLGQDCIGLAFTPTDFELAHRTQ